MTLFGRRPPETPQTEQTPQPAPTTPPAVPFGATVTIFFSDIRGFTEYTNEYGDAAAFQILQRHNAIVRQQIEAFGGHVVKTQGDSFMVAFNTARGAILCASAVQRTIAETNQNETRTRIAIGIGINTGEPIQEGGDFFGSTVNLASRICAAAGPAQILISETTRHVAGRIEALEYVDYGLHELKGFSEPLRLFEVNWDPRATQAPTAGGGAEAAEAAELDAAVQRAIIVVNTVLTISHADDPDFRPLLACQAKASELRLMLSQAGADRRRWSTQRVEEAIAPFADLLAMVAGPESLDDQHWAQLEERVNRTFGRQLSIAATRSRLALGGDATAIKPAPRPEPARTEAMPRPEPVRHPEPSRTEVSHPEPVRKDVAPRPEPPRGEPKPRPAPARAEAPAAAPPRAQPSGDRGLQEATPPAPVDARAAAVRWWAAAHAGWVEWKSSGMALAHAVRAALMRHPHLLSVPIYEGAEHGGGGLAHDYFPLLEHVEAKSAGFLRSAVAQALEATGGSRDAAALGPKLFEALLTRGRLAETYGSFVRDVMIAGIPTPGVWVDVVLTESDNATVVMTRPTERLGDAQEQAERLTDSRTRAQAHQFAMTIAPLTTRFFHVKTGNLKSSRDVELRLTSNGAPSDHGWHLTLKTSHVVHSTQRLEGQRTALPGLGRAYSAVWIAVFNPDPGKASRYELTLSLSTQAAPSIFSAFGRRK